ncbi:MAG TPA: PAC2 family protein [Candidatus Nanoarchaeia archaeon]|nr:PAC2 family protein [Candidatus Nanoarchaeia archaeon]
MSWKLNYTAKKPKLNHPILIEGLPGIGNVGKVAIDFVIDEMRAKKIAEFQSNELPHTVFVNEQNLVDLPSIEVYCKKFGNGKRDLLLVAGDIQPATETGCYTFCDAVLDMAQEYNCDEIITLGGIALKQEPPHPKVFCTGNNKEIVDNYAKTAQISKNLYGVVGPIVGVSGVLLGLAKRRKIKAVSLLAETYGHPLYLGISGAREILKALKKKLKVDVDIHLLDKEIAEIEQELHPRLAKLTKGKDVNYIG